MNLKEAKALHGADTLLYSKKAVAHWEDQVCKAAGDKSKRVWAMYKVHLFKAYVARHEAKSISENKFNFRDDYLKAMSHHKVEEKLRLSMLELEQAEKHLSRWAEV